jgi:hypothetical protein
MVNKRYTLEDAQKFVNRFGHKDLAGILYDFGNFKEAVRTLVNKGDVENFNLLTKKYLEKVNADGQRTMKRDAYILLETLCYDVDNRFMERKGKAVKLYEKYLKKIEIKYDIDGYSPKEIYEKINSLSDSLGKYTNFVSKFVSKAKKTWNWRKNAMNFKLRVKDFDISGNVKLDGNELIVISNIPLAARVYRKPIAKTIRGKLEKALPKLSESK